VREYLATLDDAAFGAASEVMPKFVSPTDPAAQWTGAMRGPAFFAYADNYLVDVRFGIMRPTRALRSQCLCQVSGPVSPLCKEPMVGTGPKIEAPASLL
jgi:hypothetical protein